MDQYTQQKTLLTTDCDLASAWRPSAILELMQDVAGVHGTMLGFGREQLLRQGLVWVITRLEVEMDRYPHFCDTISVTTFPTANRRSFFPRWFTFHDADGREFGRASSLWVLLNFEERRMVSPEPVASLLPDNSLLPLPLPFPPACSDVQGEKTERPYTPQYADLDLNMHMNNTKYLDLCCNALGIEQMTTRCLRRFAVNYHKEIRAGQQLTTCLSKNGDDFSFSGMEGDIRHFDISGTLMPR